MLTHMATRLASTHPSRLVCRARRSPDARAQHAVRPSPQRHRAEAVHDESVSPSRRQSAGVSHRARAPLQPGPLSASGPACRSMRRGSGRWKVTFPTRNRRFPFECPRWSNEATGHIAFMHRFVYKGIGLGRSAALATDTEEHA